MASSSLASENAHYRDSRFGCNICLESVVDPVVTLCGHLYCWPCLFRWLEPGMTASEFAALWGHSRSAPVDTSRRTCPVCKATCSVATVVPIYVRGNHEIGDRSTKAKSTTANIGATIQENDDYVSSPSQDGRCEYVGVRRRLLFNQQQLPARPLLVSPSQQPAPVTTPHSPPPLSTGLAMSLQHTLFGTVIPPLHHYRQEQLEHDPATEFLSRVLLMLGSFVILCLLLF